MIQDAKNDKNYKGEVDGLIYEASLQEESDRSIKRRSIENAIVMPMVSTKGLVVGVIQIANSEKQNPFTDLDMDIMRLFSSKMGQFIAETRE